MGRGSSCSFGFAIKRHARLEARVEFYWQLTGVTDRTAARDLDDLVRKGILERTARTGRGAGYQVVQKPDRNPTNPT